MRPRPEDEIIYYTVFANIQFFSEKSHTEIIILTWKQNLQLSVQYAGKCP